MRCVFCRMTVTQRFLRLPMCSICRDQSYDFLWASSVQVVITAAGGMGIRAFTVNEVLLFIVLVVVKHRVAAPWDRPNRQH